MWQIQPLGLAANFAKNTVCWERTHRWRLCPAHNPSLNRQSGFKPSRLPGFNNNNNNKPWQCLTRTACWQRQHDEAGTHTQPQQQEEVGGFNNCFMLGSSITWQLWTAVHSLARCTQPTPHLFSPPLHCAPPTHQPTTCHAARPTVCAATRCWLHMRAQHPHAGGRCVQEFCVQQIHCLRSGAAWAGIELAQRCRTVAQAVAVSSGQVWRTVKARVPCVRPTGCVLHTITHLCPSPLSPFFCRAPCSHHTYTTQHTNRLSSCWR